MTTKKKSDNNGKGVLVTTDKRGVFFGYLIGDPSPAEVRLKSMRNVVYWDVAAKGFNGLAATGPTPGCRITAPAGAESILYGITAVVACTAEAIKRFEEAPWSR